MIWRRVDTPSWHIWAQRMTLVALLLGPAACKGGDDCYGPDGPMSAGDSYMEDCNTCTCGEDGRISCTEKACLACTYEGTGYAVGESWAAGDGCNLCQCLEGGTVECTTSSCQ